jgi:hypothetical protein
MSDSAGLIGEASTALRMRSFEASKESRSGTIIDGGKRLYCGWLVMSSRRPTLTPDSALSDWTNSEIGGIPANMIGVRL